MTKPIVQGFRTCGVLLRTMLNVAVIVMLTLSYRAAAFGRDVRYAPDRPAAAPAAAVGDLTMTSASLVSLFSSGMVLQQGGATSVWGTGSSNASLAVELLGADGTVLSQAQSQSDANGRWQVALPVPVGGPYTLEMIGASAAVLASVAPVYGGEVWLCSGQSNMARQISLTDVTVNTGPDPQLSLFTVGSATATSVLSDQANRWSWFSNAKTPVALDNPGPPASTMPTIANFSGLCYEFGKRLRSQLNVPVGLIESALGGSAIEEWLPYGRIPPTPRPKGGVPVAYGDAYNAMIAWLIPYTIEGVLWHQGNGNVSGSISPSKSIAGTDYGAFRYLSLLPILVSEWRKLWAANFAFLEVQLESNGCASNDVLYLSPYEAELREAQRLATSGIYGAAFVPTFDWGALTTNDVHTPATTYQGRTIVDYGRLAGAKGCGSAQPNPLNPVPMAQGYVHPPFKAVVGDRAFDQAMALVYGAPPANQAPDLVVTGLSTSGAVLAAHNLGQATLRLTPGSADTITGFGLCCSSSGQYISAHGVINSDSSITVTPDSAANLAGVAQKVRYGWTNYIASPADIAQQITGPWNLPIANAVTDSGLPVLGFSSEPYWMSANIARSKTRDPARIPSVYYQMAGQVTQIVANPDGSRDIRGWACAQHHWDSVYVTLTVGSGQSGGTIGPALANVGPNDPSVSAACAITGSPIVNGFDFTLAPSIAPGLAGGTVNVTGHSPQGFGDFLLPGSGQPLP